jgi:DNA-directed RNA polymerase subunit RPC12/RpoP
MSDLCSDIKYLCHDCRKELGSVNVGFHAVNEVGRKSCDRCGSNRDNLNVVNLYTFDKLMAQFKAISIIKVGD